MMKLFKHRVESLQFKRNLNKFYRTKIKPVLLSIQHFFKSSHKYFKKHPKIRFASTVLGLFVLIIVISAVYNTFSANKIAYENDNYNSYREEYWNELYNYVRPNQNLNYISNSGNTGSCAAGLTLPFNHTLDLTECALSGEGKENTPYLINTIEEFMYVRTLGQNAKGLFFKVNANLDFTGVSLQVYNSNDLTGLFAGVLDGDFNHIKGVQLSISGNSTLAANGLIPGIYGDNTHPAVVKNFIIDDANITIPAAQTGGIRTVGALVGFIGPYGYALNNGLLSGNLNANDTITADNNTLANGLFAGTLFGYLSDFDLTNYDSYNRNANNRECINGIINSYSYANARISQTPNGTVKIGGVLGSRSINTNYTNAKHSLFFNSAYYGYITATQATDYQFVYNGRQLINSSISPFNAYYWYKGNKRDIKIDDQTWAIAQNSDYLESDGFAANFNSYRDVINFYFNDAWDSNNANYLAESVNVVEWYISKTDYNGERQRFPIIRKKVTERRTSNNITASGRKISVTFDANGHGSSRVMNMSLTDMDQSIDDYVNRKITLPFAIDVIGVNQYQSNNIYYTFNGWRITAINGQTFNGYGGIEGLNYNYTERAGYQGYVKNAYEVFAEGGYYLVPDDVTSITFTAVWAKTIFASDEYNQLAFNIVNYQQNNSSNGYGRKGYTNGSGRTPSTPVAGLSNAYEKLRDIKTDSDDMYTLAIVLVGNVHYSPGQDSSTTQVCNWVNSFPVTIRSTDVDGDKKPDYSLYFRNLAKMFMPTVRFDFINVLGIPQIGGYSGMLGALYLNDDSVFETTETVITDHITVYQRIADHVKILGGYIDIYSTDEVSLNQSRYSKYLIFGGNAYSNVVSGGLHHGGSGAKNFSPAINIVGGRVKLVSTQYSPQAESVLYAYVYIDSGYIDSYYSIYRSSEALRVLTNTNYANINHYYGGGFTDTSNVKKGIRSTINNSRIGEVYGGPQFGKVEGNLELYINNSVVDYVYGGGYGGTQDYLFETSRINNTGSTTGFNSSGFNYQPGSISDQWIDTSTYIYLMKKNYITRIYSLNAQVYNEIQYVYTYLSLAQTNAVRLTIEDSRVNHDIYGGANKGKVLGNIYLNLHNVSVGGSIYGGSYSGEIDDVYVNESTTLSAPEFINYAMDTVRRPTNETKYRWIYLPRNYDVINTTNKTLGSYNFNDIGLTKANNIYVNLSGDKNGHYRMRVEGDVFGGSNLAPTVLDNGNGTVHMNITDGVYVKGGVYGGSKLAQLNGNTNVIVDNRDPNNVSEIGEVYANGMEGKVSGNALVTISGNPKVGSVYGGGNKTSDTQTEVFIEGGEIGYVYGGSNYDGVVDETRVYIGKKGPATRNPGITTYSDLCTSKAIGYKLDNLGVNNGGQNLTVYNNTNIRFVEYTINFEFDDNSKRSVQGLKNTSWNQNLTNTYSDGYYSVYGTQRYDPQSLNPLEPRDQKGSNGLRFVNASGTYIPISIKSVSFEGYDENNVRYSFKNCPNTYMLNNRTNNTVSVSSATPTYQTNMGNIQVDNVFGGNNHGGRSLNTNVLVLPDNYETRNTSASQYTVRVGNVFGGGNEAQTGPDVDNMSESQLRNIDTYEHNKYGWSDFPNGKKFVPDYKARVVIYGAHVTGDVYGGGKGNDEKSTITGLSTMYATPFVLITQGAQVDGSVFGGGFARNANVGKGAPANMDENDPNIRYHRFYVKPFVFIDWGTVNGNVYGGGYGDVVYGGTITYGTMVTLYQISDIAQRQYFGMKDDNISGGFSSYHEHQISSSLYNSMSAAEKQKVTREGNNYYIKYTDSSKAGFQPSPFWQLSACNTNDSCYVHIKGSMFGGGERGLKESGFDYLFESVMDGTTVYIEEASYCPITIDGDIFGSGNYSSSHGYSNILIKDIGKNSPKKIKSIQRAGRVFINGSNIELTGGIDVTNKFNKTKYAFSRVEDLRLGDNTTLYLGAQANLLEKVSFYVDWTAMHDDGWTFETDATLTSVNYNQNNTMNDDGENKVIVNGLNNGSGKLNRIYLQNNKGLNILTSEEVGTDFGEVNGIAFFGIYSRDTNGNIDTGYYNKNYDFNKTVRWQNKSDFNSYILGKNNGKGYNDIYKNGFITNTIQNPGTYNAVTRTVFVNASPRNQLYYYWTIGNPIIATEINLTASKYIRSGMKALTLNNYKDYGNITFDISDIDVSGLITEANFIDPSAVPTLAENEYDALNTFGLSIETSDTGWVNEGFTYFDSDYNGGSRTADIQGTTRYDAVGSISIPKLIFNLENSRNIKSNVDLGYVIITINSHAFPKDDPLNAVNSSFKVRINMDTYYYEDNEYESSMAPGKHFKSFLSAKTDITSKSEFSAYFNLYARGIDLYEDMRVRLGLQDAVFDHVLYSTYRLPVGTRITMLDISTNDPKYYYYVIDGSEYLLTESHKKVTGELATVYAYPVSLFRSMDSTTSGDRYDEAINQSRYVFQDGDTISTIEQFIFTVDFKDVTQHNKAIDQIRNEEFFLGLRSTLSDGTYMKQAYPMYETLQDMHFNLFDESNVSFDLSIQNAPDDDDTIYVDDIFTFDSIVDVGDGRVGDYLVKNTNYYQDRLGLRIGLYHITEDESGNEKATLVSGDELAGAVFYVDGLGYAPAANGFVRLKMADFVVPVRREIKVDLSNAEHLTSGLYEFRVTAFASADGLYAKQGDSITNSSESFRVNLVNEHYGLLSTIDDEKDVIVYSNGKTSGGTDTIETTINYFGSYGNPNIKISLKRRDYSSVENYDYNDVNIADYFDISSTTFSDTSQLDRTDLFDLNTMTISKDALVNHVTSSDMGIYYLTFKLKQGVDLPTGTYRIMYNLYNGNKEVGDVYTYIIIKD